LTDFLGVAPFPTARVSGYDYGAPVPPGGWSPKYPGQSFGLTKHTGVNYGTPAGTRIVAPFPGVAKFTTGLFGYGNQLTLTLSNGYKFFFSHVAAGVNGPVAAGQQIALSGHDVGSSVGEVTLVEVKNPSGQFVNPHTYLDPLFRGAGSASGLFGAASGQLLSNAQQAAQNVGGQLAAAPGAIAGGMPQINLNLPAGFDTLVSNLNQVIAQQEQALSQGPLAKLFGLTQQPRIIFFRGIFSGLGLLMVVLGVIIYFKGDDVKSTVVNVLPSGGGSSSGGGRSKKGGKAKSGGGAAPAAGEGEAAAAPAAEAAEVAPLAVVA